MKKQHKFNPENASWVDRMNRLKDDFQDLEKITDKWGFFRQIYIEMIPFILERSRADINQIINPYTVDWRPFLSPIEFSAWSSIRGHYVALYPQFPLFNYFIDFANPYLRIGIEMDGKDYHDAKRDAARDTMLWRYGWKIFRIPGKECFTKYLSYENTAELEYKSNEDRLDDLRNWIVNSADGFIYAIKKVYFQKNEDHELYDDFLYSLNRHKGADFEIIDLQKQ